VETVFSTGESRWAGGHGIQTYDKFLFCKNRFYSSAMTDTVQLLRLRKCKKAFSFRGASAPGTLTRGSTSGPRYILLYFDCR